MIHFDLEASRKHRLLNGLDDIGMTLERAPGISTFEQKLAEDRPWA